MQSIYIHISSLIGLFIFMSQLIRHAPLDRTIVAGVGSGLGVYLVLMMAGLAVRRIVAGSEQGGADGRTAGSRTETEPDKEPAPAA